MLAFVSQLISMVLELLTLASGNFISFHFSICFLEHVQTYTYLSKVTLLNNAFKMTDRGITTTFDGTSNSARPLRGLHSVTGARASFLMT